MKITVVTKHAAVKLRSRWDVTALRVESMWRRGHVEVVSVLCRDCGRWVAPDAWNPASAFCEVCTDHQAREVLARARFAKKPHGFSGLAGVL